ncbi:hypothetical protein M405DRAFT_834514 [Rhizopogon salebrosus TDB-379]|nr:hypothetical protein M405DRAFT_834514 [Rhizopogon salebrosus TDB-379]
MKILSIPNAGVHMAHGHVCPYAPRHDQKCYTSSTLSNTKNPVASLLSTPLVLTSHPTSRSTTSPAPNNVYQRCPAQK